MSCFIKLVSRTKYNLGDGVEEIMHILRWTHTYTSDVYFYWYCEFDSCLWWGVLYTTLCIKFVSDSIVFFQNHYNMVVILNLDLLIFTKVASVIPTHGYIDELDTSLCNKVCQ